MDQLNLNGIDFSPELNLARYLQSIRRYPILSQEDEYNLAIEYQRTKNIQVAYKLVTSHLRLVVKVVSKYRGYGLPVAEMISEGNIGLLYAVDKFEPEKGFRFSTYALWWIKASVQKYILNSWSLVKIGTTAAQKKLSRRERAENLKGSFRVHERVKCRGKRILVIDDVLTTGATASAVAEALLRAGAARVCVLTAASVPYALLRGGGEKAVF